MGSKTKEVTGFQIEPLTEHPENVYRDLFLNVGKQGRNGGKALTDTFGSTIRELNGILQPKLVAKMGYETSYDMPYKAIDTAAAEASASTFLTTTNTEYDSIASVEFRDPTPDEALLKKLVSLKSTLASIKFTLDPTTLDYTTETDGVVTQYIHATNVTDALGISGYYYKEIDAGSAAVSAWVAANYPNTATTGNPQTSTSYAVTGSKDVKFDKDDNKLKMEVTLSKTVNTSSSYSTTTSGTPFTPPPPPASGGTPVTVTDTSTNSYVDPSTGTVTATTVTTSNTTNSVTGASSSSSNTTTTIDNPTTGFSSTTVDTVTNSSGSGSSENTTSHSYSASDPIAGSLNSEHTYDSSSTTPTSSSSTHTSEVYSKDLTTNVVNSTSTTTTSSTSSDPTTGSTTSSGSSTSSVVSTIIAKRVIPHTTIVGDSPYKDFAQLVMSYNGYSYAAEDYLYGGDTPSIVHIAVNTTYLGGTQYSVAATPGLFTRNADSEAIKYVVSKIEAANIDRIFLVIKYMSKGDEYTTFVRVDDNANFYKIAHADAMPLLPLKEDFKVLEKDKKLNKLLGEIGIQQSAFKETLESKDLHSAYISFLVPLDLDVPELVDYAYTFFTEVAPDATNTIQMSQRYGTDDSVKINWTFTVTNTTMVGSIGAIDKLTATLGSRVVDDGVGWFGSEGTDTSRTIATLTLKKQLTENSYKEIHISDGGAAYAFDRWRFDEGSASIWTNKDRIPYGIESEYFRLPLLRPAFIAMPFNVKCFIFGKSLCMLAFILKYVKVKWYQTGLFKMIMMAVSVVLMVWAGIPPGWIMASVGLQMAVMAGLITGKVAMIVGIVVALVSGNFQSMVASATKDTLALASTLVNVVSGIYGTIVEGQIKGYAKAAAAATAEADKAREELKEETDTLGNPINLFGATLDYNSYWYIASGEVQYAYDSLYDYDTAIFNTDSKTSIGM